MNPNPKILSNAIRAAMLTVMVMAFSLMLARGPISLNRVRFHDPEHDTTRIAVMLTEVAALNLPTAGDRVIALGKRMLDTPYVAHTLEADSVGAPEMLTVNLDQLDCTTFVETVAAMALTIGEGRTGWRDFIYNLERVRYRDGQMDGYPSRLHYVADWILNNISKGIITEHTADMDGVRYACKTIDFMSTNAKRYPAMADSANLARVRATEEGYRSHQYPYIRTADTGTKKARQVYHNGDLLAFTSSLRDLDVTHMGILMIDPDGTPRVMHASSSLGKVTVTTVPLHEFLKNNRSLTGIRLLRLTPR